MDSSSSTEAACLPPGTRVSDYLRVSDHQYAARGGRPLALALSTRTGDLVAIDPSTAEQLRRREVPADAGEATVASLLRAEILIAPTADEFADLCARNAAAAEDPVRREFIVFPTSYCNMACTYCGQEHRKAPVDPGHRDAVRARVLEAIADPRTETVDVRWFGAEPMMGYASVIDLGRSFTEAARRHRVGYRSSMITNGSLLTVAKLQELWARARVQNFVVSIDGPRGTHERRRPLKSGRTSFDRILTTIAEAVRSPGLEEIVFEIRTNVDETNLGEVRELLAQAAELGLAHPRILFHASPVHTWSPDNDQSDRTVQWSGFARAEIEWMAAAEALGLGFRTLPRGAKAITCEAVSTAAEVIAADGGIYSCVEHPLVPGVEAATVLATLGDLGASARRPRGAFDDWTEADLLGRRVPCHGCPIFGVCGGACPKQWREGQIPCPSYKDPANMQARFDLAAAHHGLVRAT